MEAGVEFLEPWLAKAGRPTLKKDLRLLAGVIEPGEIHPEVVGVLDQIGKLARG